MDTLIEVNLKLEFSPENLFSTQIILKKKILMLKSLRKKR